MGSSPAKQIKFQAKKVSCRSELKNIFGFFCFLSLYLRDLDDAAMYAVILLARPDV